MEALANEHRWALMSGGEADSGAQTLIDPSRNLAHTGFNLLRSGTALCSKTPLRDLSIEKGRN